MPYLFTIAMDFKTRWSTKLVQTSAWNLPYQDMTPCLLYVDGALFFIKPEVRSVKMLKIAFTVFKQI